MKIRNALGHFTIAEAARYLELPPKDLYRAVEHGFVFPPDNGGGRRKYYSPSDVERIRQLLDEKLASQN